MKSFAWIAMALTCSACTLKVPGSKVNLRIEIPQDRGALSLATRFEELGRPFASFAGTIPSTIALMDCYFLNVNGPGIEADGSGSGRELSFLDLGVTSTLAAAADGAVTMRVPSGLARTIQVMGIAANPPLLGQCAGLTPAELLILQRPALFELGRTTSALYQDATVTVQSVYNPFTAYDLMSEYQGSLLLNQGYTGTNTSGGINTLGGGLPPSGMTDITGASGSLPSQFASLQNPATTNAGLLHAVNAVGNIFARLDFAFALGSIDTSQYSTFRIDALIGGGFSNFVSGACQAPAANTRVDLAVYAPNDFPPWSTAASSTTTASSAVSLELPLTTQHMDTYEGQRYIHIGILSTDAANGNCSNIRVDQLKITLVK